MMVVERPGILPQAEFYVVMETFRGFKNDLEQNASISDVTSTLMIPGRKMRWKAAVGKHGEAETETHVFHLNIVDFNFLSAFELDLVAGREFSMEYGTDEDTACIISRTGARVLGFDDPTDAIGQSLQWSGYRQGGIIVGVTEDYHQESLHEAAPPVLFVPSDYAEFFLMHVSTEELPQTLKSIEGVWESRFPGNPFHFYFLDEYFDQQYRNDRRFGRIFGLFAFLAMVVGCLGLFGLSAYMAQQRFKEIGVRKVLGASTSQIWVLLTRDFVELVLLANVLAWPLIAWGMNRWLEGFALRTSLNWGLFALAGVAVLAIALLTVSYQAYRVANIQPAEALRTE